LADYFPTQFYLKTIRPLYSFHFDSTEMLSMFSILSTEPSVSEYLLKLLDLYKWHQVDDLVGVAAVLEKNESWSCSLSSEQIRRRLAFVLVAPSISDMLVHLRKDTSRLGFANLKVPGKPI